MRLRHGLALALVAVLATACGSDDAAPRGSIVWGGSTPAADTALPAECVQPPFTVVAERDGDNAVGSATYEVTSTVGLPIPLVPNKDGAISGVDVMSKGADTDLLGYVLFFGDEQFGPGDVSMFGGYAPTAEGHSRGTVSIFPHTTTPLAAGDVLTPGLLDGLDMTTTLFRVTMDFKATPDELTSYLDTIKGSVRIVAVTETTLCLDVDLTWDYSDFSSEALGALTVKGIFTATLAPRTMAFT
ncbi:MAG: hypothetical protein Q7V57_01605 [Actinomycetota bacterium]|nr:hypothetical protein [Actinomycetota bacterium]